MQVLRSLTILPSRASNNQAVYIEKKQTPCDSLFDRLLSGEGIYQSLVVTLYVGLLLCCLFLATLYT